MMTRNWKIYIKLLCFALVFALMCTSVLPGGVSRADQLTGPWWQSSESYQHFISYPTEATQAMRNRVFNGNSPTDFTVAGIHYKLGYTERKAVNIGSAPTFTQLRIIDSSSNIMNTNNLATAIDSNGSTVTGVTLSSEQHSTITGLSSSGVFIDIIALVTFVLPIVGGVIALISPIIDQFMQTFAQLRCGYKFKIMPYNIPSGKYTLQILYNGVDETVRIPFSVSRDSAFGITEANGVSTSGKDLTKSENMITWDINSNPNQIVLKGYYIAGKVNPSSGEAVGVTKMTAAIPVGAVSAKIQSSVVDFKNQDTSVDGFTYLSQTSIDLIKSRFPLVGQGYGSTDNYNNDKTRNLGFDFRITLKLNDILKPYIKSGSVKNLTFSFAPTQGSGLQSQTIPIKFKSAPPSSGSLEAVGEILDPVAGAVYDAGIVPSTAKPGTYIYTMPVKGAYFLGNKNGITKIELNIPEIDTPPKKVDLDPLLDTDPLYKDNKKIAAYSAYQYIYKSTFNGVYSNVYFNGSYPVDLVKLKRTLPTDATLKVIHVKATITDTVGHSYIMNQEVKIEFKPEPVPEPKGPIEVYFNTTEKVYSDSSFVLSESNLVPDDNGGNYKNPYSLSTSVSVYKKDSKGYERQIREVQVAITGLSVKNVVYDAMYNSLDSKGYEKWTVTLPIDFKKLKTGNANLFARASVFNTHTKKIEYVDFRGSLFVKRVSGEAQKSLCQLETPKKNGTVLLPMITNANKNINIQIPVTGVFLDGGFSGFESAKIYLDGTLKSVVDWSSGSDKLQTMDETVVSAAYGGLYHNTIIDPDNSTVVTRNSYTVRYSGDLNVKNSTIKAGRHKITALVTTFDGRKYTVEQPITIQRVKTHAPTIRTPSKDTVLTAGSSVTVSVYDFGYDLKTLKYKWSSSPGFTPVTLDSGKKQDDIPIPVSTPLSYTLNLEAIDKNGSSTKFAITFAQ